MPKISVIVPVYNAASCLERTIDAILCQSYLDFELILIDDGSKDNSLEICKSYIYKDNRVRLIKKYNGGVSSARNVGLEVACGEWICFIDSDDEMLTGALEAYHNAMADGVDVIRAGFERQKNGCTSIIRTNTIVTDDKETVIVKCNETRYEAYLWNTCFRRSAINDITFKEDLSFCEDHLFTYTVIAQSRKVSFISDVVYRYYAPITNSSAPNLSARYLEPSMILAGAELEKNVKLSCLTDTNQKGILITNEEYAWKVRHAVKYAVIGGKYKEAVDITRNYKECNFRLLFNLILHIKIAPYLRGIIKK